jgi:hypothetical protein
VTTRFGYSDTDHGARRRRGHRRRARSMQASMEGSDASRNLRRSMGPVTPICNAQEPAVRSNPTSTALEKNDTVG